MQAVVTAALSTQMAPPITSHASFGVRLLLKNLTAAYLEDKRQLYLTMTAEVLGLFWMNGPKIDARGAATNAAPANDIRIIALGWQPHVG